MRRLRPYVVVLPLVWRLLRSTIGLMGGLGAILAGFTVDNCVDESFVKSAEETPAALSLHTPIRPTDGRTPYRPAQFGKRQEGGGELPAVQLSNGKLADQ